MLQGLYFGAPLYYYSPIDEHLISCVYIRDENNKAVVISKNAETVVRVEHEQLKWRKY